MLDVSPGARITADFVFAFKAMGSVLPIAGFFFVGAGETARADPGRGCRQGALACSSN